MSWSCSDRGALGSASGWGVLDAPHLRRHDILSLSGKCDPIALSFVVHRPVCCSLDHRYVMLCLDQTDRNDDVMVCLDSRFMAWSLYLIGSESGKGGTEEINNSMIPGKAWTVTKDLFPRNLTEQAKQGGKK